MSIDERVTAFMGARGFWLDGIEEDTWWVSPSSQKPTICFSRECATLMYRLHLEAMKEEIQGTKEWTQLPIIVRDLDPTALLVMRTAADKRIATLDKLIAEAK